MGMTRVIVGLLGALGACKATPTPAHDDAPVGDAVLADAARDASVDAPAALPCTITAGSTIAMRHLGKLPNAALLVTAPPDDGRLFVLEQPGAIRIFEHEQLRPTPFLDLSAEAGGPVLSGGEQGLLGLAFHPRYATNRYFYVFYTTGNPGAPPPYLDVVVRYTASATDPFVADPTSATPILAIPDFATNHNGGMMEFGSDGMLYVGTGDGGAGGDPIRNGQNRHALLAKMLRLDVDHPGNGKAYGIPADNPFADGVDGAPEVWMYGLRNPWRWSFDRGTGDLWIGDVGQGLSEELDVVVAGQQAGVNLGWSAYEGATCCQLAADRCAQGTSPQQPCDPVGKHVPEDVRTHASGWQAIIGGQVYRGACYPDLVGWYFYTDAYKHQLVKARTKVDGSLEIVDLAPAPGTLWPEVPASLHADARGELYETTIRGDIYALEVVAP
ncbi:MAG: PQQ-dependent sugar dehydrogenase [Proteobacteria bacterium]|nr:PQQ-dependent sugar dehydrogenase [Pseudomonadota bacterium]